MIANTVLQSSNFLAFLNNALLFWQSRSSLVDLNLAIFVNSIWFDFKLIFKMQMWLTCFFLDIIYTLINWMCIFNLQTSQMNFFRVEQLLVASFGFSYPLFFSLMDTQLDFKIRLVSSQRRFFFKKSFVSPEHHLKIYTIITAGLK